MYVTQLARISGTAAVLLAMPLKTAIAQTQPPPPSPQSPPAATKPVPETSRHAVVSGQTTVSVQNQKKSGVTPATDLVGLAAKSSDGTSLGTVHSVLTGLGGKITIAVKVGGVLGLDGHMVTIPDDRFNHIGDTVQVNMTADELNKLPR
jgi:hypothetical protein